MINFRDKLLNENLITEAEFNQMEKEILKRIEDAVIFAENSPEPDSDEFLKELSQ